MREVVVILGVPVDNLNMEETLNRLEEFVYTGRATGKSHQVATINADFVVKSLHDPELRYLLQEADLATADGMPLVWGARMLGVDLEGRVAGADLIPALAERAAAKGFSIYLLGAAPTVAATAAEILQEKYPDLIIAGIHSPPYRPVLEMDEAIIEDIKRAQPDILLVAFGNPKQEKWIGMYKQRLNVPVMIGVGGTLDFIAGHTRRAPAWMQQTGLEWVHRLLQDPRRLWRRYAVDLVNFSTFFLRQWWVMRQRAAPTVVLPHADLLVVENTAVIQLAGRFTVHNGEQLRTLAQEALAAAAAILVDLSRTEFLDSSAIGILVNLANRAREAGGEMGLVNVPPPIYEVLSLIRLDNFFIFYPSIDDALRKRQQAAHEPVGQPVLVAKSNQAIAVETRWAVVQTPRRLDALTAPEVSERCLALLATNPFLILDLQETVFLASAGLAALAKINRLAVEQEGELRLTNCSSDARKVLEMVRFDKVLTVYEDLASAMT